MSNAENIQARGLMLSRSSRLINNPYSFDEVM